MNLSILCITNNEYRRTEWFIHEMRRSADALCAEFVLGLDREKAQLSDLRKYADKPLDLTANTLQEDVMDAAVSACSGDWILRLDDDETLSPALFDWLKAGWYARSFYNLYAFPRIYLYGDTRHYLANDGMYPDLQTRLGRKQLMYGVTYIHAGNPNGTGAIAPYAIEHHKLICRSYEERKAIANRYEAIRKGAGSLPEYARYNLPENFYDSMEIKDYANRGDFSK